MTENAIEDLVEIEAAAKEAKQKKMVVSRVELLKNPVLSFKRRNGATGEFEGPEYNLAENGRIGDVESMVTRAWAQKEGLMFKAGYEFTGKNPYTIKYIHERLLQIGQASGLSWEALLRGVGEDLIEFHNAFLAKVRNEDASGGRTRKIPGSERQLKPVAAYFHIPVTTIRIKRDKNGKILQYRQELPDGNYKDFSPENVIHFYVRKKKGFLIGTPPLVAVKDDIIALRRIEENVDLLVYQHLFPIFHYTVGTEEAPAETYPDGSNEVTRARLEFESMPAEGMIFTPERHKIAAVGAQGRALQVEGIIKHFKQRVIAGLGISTIDLGEADSSNRSTSDSLSKNLIDDVKNYQKILCEQVERFIVSELLLESTFPDPLASSNFVHLVFHEVDKDLQIKVENHMAQMFSQNAVTHSEMRRAMGYEPFSEEDWADSYWKRIDEPTRLILSVDEPYLAMQTVADNPNSPIGPEDVKVAQRQRKEERLAGASRRSRGQPVQASRGTRAGAAQDRPSNQHGTKEGPEKRKSSVQKEFGEYVLKDTFSFSDMVAPGNRLTEIYDRLVNDVIVSLRQGTMSETWLKALAFAAGTDMKEIMLRIARMDYSAGYKDAGAIITYADLQLGEGMLQSRIWRVVDRLIGDIIDSIGRQLTKEDMQASVLAGFDTIRFRSRFIYDFERRKAYNFGKLKGYKALGHEQIVIKHEAEACAMCVKKAGPIKTRYASIDDVPSWHPACCCVCDVPKV